MGLNTKYLFFDIDGTLAYGGGVVTDANREAILKVQKLGHKVFLNTGRSLANIPSATLNSIRWDGIVAGTGYVEYGGEVLYLKTMPADALEEIYSYCEEKGFECLFEGVDRLYTNTHNDWSEFIADHRPFPDEMKVTNVTVGAALPDEDLGRLNRSKIVRMPDYFEANNLGHGKDTGIRIIEEHCGADNADTIAFGDSMNDLEMLQYAGTSVVMASAPEELRSIADICATESDGVAEALRIIFKI
ncbi:MAG: HAD-IIB family hydrolase [Clostridia bacterium]|nr:HAD-IIB family hydrolase [Clostridia bacterium]